MKRFHLGRLLISGLLLTAVLLQCSDRDRTNPFDPHKQGKNSNPLELELWSDTHSIYLDWVPSISPDLTGYNVYRTGIGDSLQLLAALGDSITWYIDSDIELNTTYVYSLTAQGEENETPFTTYDTITPGPTRWWVLADSYNALSHLSHDGLHLYASYNLYGSPEFVVAPINRELIYTYDRFNGTLFRHIPGQEPSELMTGISNVTEMLYRDISNDVYLLKRTGEVQVYDLDNRISRSVTFPKPLEAGANDNAGNLWVGAGDTLYTLNGGSLNYQPIIALPDTQIISSIAESEDGRVYISTAGANTVYLWDGGELDPAITDVPYPLQLEYNANDRSLWIRSYDASKKVYMIYRYDGNVTQLMYTAAKEVYDIAVNPVSDVCLVAEYKSGGIIQIAPNGARRSFRDFPGKGYQIVVQPIANL